MDYIDFVYYFENFNYKLSILIKTYYLYYFSFVLFISAIIGLSPVSIDKSHHSGEVVLIYLRKLLLFSIFLVIIIIGINFSFYITSFQDVISASKNYFIFVFRPMLNDFIMPLGSLISGLYIGFLIKRYFIPLFSKILRSIRINQKTEALSDIRSLKLIAKDYTPSNYYKEGNMLIGIDGGDNGVYVATNDWREANMQVIGPTRYGKGIIFGILIDQAVSNDDCVFYIDPKSDRFIPHIMYQQAKANNKPFYYVALHDELPGCWAPFLGGTEEDAFSRLIVGLGLEQTGDPGTDYYKGQETELLRKAFTNSRQINSLYNEVRKAEGSRAKSGLAELKQIKSLNGKGFSIEKALKEGAVVYVQGSLDNQSVKTATKIFIMELIQEKRRLFKEQELSRINNNSSSVESKNYHTTAFIDEVSFIVTKVLVQALATSLGFNLNFCLAYQSQNDLLNLDDSTVDPRYAYNSINVNCQLKAVYGGADFETAKFVADLSGLVQKKIVTMEKTNVSVYGGETWDNSRTLADKEVNLVTTNDVQGLPRRVCITVRPHQLATITYTSFIEVKDEKPLNDLILGQMHEIKTPIEEESKEEINVHVSDMQTVKVKSNGEKTKAKKVEIVEDSDWSLDNL